MGGCCWGKVLSNRAWPGRGPGRQPGGTTATALAKPFIQVLLYERVILQVRIRFANPVDFFHLARGEILVQIKTPASFEQPLASQNLMNAGNTSTKLVDGIKDRSVRVGDLLGQSELCAG